jgi:dihydroflavonol-4-reductase
MLFAEPSTVVRVHHNRMARLKTPGYARLAEERGWQEAALRPARRSGGGPVAVTGATGHVGGNLVRALHAQGRPVRAFVLPGDPLSTLEGLGVEYVTGDLGDRASLVRAFDGAEVVYHLAGYISIMPGEEELLRAVNVDGVRNVVAACLDRRVKRLVHFSSIHALSPHPSERPIDETQPPASGDGVPPYDRSKAAGELEVAEGVARGLDAVVVNPTGIIGPVDYRPSRMGRFFLSLCQRSLPGTVRGGFNWVDVRDVVTGAMAAEERGRTGERYILGGHWASLQDLALLVEQTIGTPPPFLDAPLGLATLIAPVASRWALWRRTEALFTPFSLHALRSHQRISWAKAAHEFGYGARPVRETVEAIIAWFRSAGLLPAAAVPPVTGKHEELHARLAAGVQWD